MAVDARKMRRIHTLGSESFKLSIHEIEPQFIAPNGDRYVVEFIPVDEAVEFGTILVVTDADPNSKNPDNDPRNPMAKHEVEKRGVVPAVVIQVGNGHLLGIPDMKIAVSPDTCRREPSDVPMFYHPGDVVLVDVNARGRALRIAGRQIYICGQMDVLGQIIGTRLKWTENGWARE